MNSDYIISGKGQSALMGASWAPARASAESAAYETYDVADTGEASASDEISSSEKLRKNVASARNRGPEVMQAELTFEDLVDIVNPLQQIPVLNMAYRAITGDKISGFAQVAGGALYGGAVGMIAGIANAILEEETGKNAGATVVAALFGDDAAKANEPIPGEPANTMLAAAEPAPAGEAAGETVREVAAETAVADAAPAAKQPFGGIMEPARQMAATPEAETGTGTGKAVAPSTSDLADAATSAQGSAADGRKFYNLANAVRRGGGEPAHMPLRNAPDVRMKSFNLMAGTSNRANTAAMDQQLAAQLAGMDDTTIPLASPAAASKVLGLDASTKSTAAASATAHMALTPGGNPLPPQLVEDMMKMAIDKYQQGQNSGQFSKPAAVDING